MEINFPYELLFLWYSLWRDGTAGKLLSVMGPLFAYQILERIELLTRSERRKWTVLSVIATIERKNKYWSFCRRIVVKIRNRPGDVYNFDQCIGTHVKKLL